MVIWALVSEQSCCSSLKQCISVHAWRARFLYYRLNVNSQVYRLQRVWILLHNLLYKYSYRSFVKARCNALKNLRWEKQSSQSLIQWINLTFPIYKETNQICVLPWKRKDVKCSWLLDSSWNCFKHEGVFLLQLRRMQEMIAQMQAQMRMKPGDD